MLQFIIILIVISLVAIYWKQFFGIIAILLVVAFFLFYKSLKKYKEIFNKWDKEIHRTLEQRTRVYRALHDGLILHRFTGNESAEIIGKSGEIYQVSLQSCTCPDFEERQQPCKHMYFLAKELKKLNKMDLWLLSNEPKKKNNNSQFKKVEKHPTSIGDITITTSYSVKDNEKGEL